jgi:hypothetical protein
MKTSSVKLHETRKKYVERIQCKGTLRYNIACWV